MQQQRNGSQSLRERIDTIEEAYEFMLAYAAQGRARNEEGDEIRRFLERARAALDGLASVSADTVRSTADAKIDAYRDFFEVLDQDASKARAAVDVVLGQASISSQIIDNLNASIHLRALLADLFLIDESLRTTAAS